MTSMTMQTEDDTPAQRFAKDQLKSLVERIERLESEKQAIADDIKDVFAEAKGNGFCPKALKTILKIRKQDKDERAEQEAIVDTYLQALGMLPGFEYAEQKPPRPSRAAQSQREPAGAAAASRRDDRVTSGPLIGSDAANPAEGGTSRLDDLGSVQDGLEMSTDGQRGDALHTSHLERQMPFGVTPRRDEEPVSSSRPSDTEIPTFLRRDKNNVPGFARKEPAHPTHS